MGSERSLSAEEKKGLLAAARRTVAKLVGAQTEAPEPPEDLDAYSFQRGAFVTLHKHGQLRGCIGNFMSRQPLQKTVEEMAEAAACQDPRFPPLAREELADIDLEISVLSPLRRIEDVNEIQVGVHGIYMVSPRGRGVLLPQVATEYGWDRRTFLENTCLKAGLNPGCWQDEDVEILIFSAEVFGEKDLA